MLGLRVRGRGGRDPTAPVAAPLSAFLWGSTPFLCARAKKWGGTGSRGHNPPPNKTAHTHNPKTPTSPPPKVGRGTSRPPTCSAHANGGAAEVKKGAFLWRLDTVSLGKHQRNGVESQQGPTTTSQRIGAHAETKRKGGTPGEGSPLDPLLRFNKHKRVPRSAERGQGRCPWTLPPLKRWAKLSDALRAARKKRKRAADLRSFFWWGRVDSNHRRHCQQIYSLSPLATREHPRVRFTQRGAGGRTRTPDLLITNQLLYRLSYTSAIPATAIIAKPDPFVNKKLLPCPIFSLRPPCPPCRSTSRRPSCP